MNDDEIAKLAAQLTVSLATKDDIKDLKTDIEKLERKIDNLDQKANTILEFAEAVDETTTSLNQRLRKVESISIIAHELKNPKL